MINDIYYFFIFIFIAGNKLHFNPINNELGINQPIYGPKPKAK